MENWTIFIILIVSGYLLGSIPASYLAARSRGIDLRKHGTRQVGGGNLWRTTSRRLGLAVVIFDFFKGIVMVIIGFRLELNAGQQLAVGLAVIVGHNWPVFLRFHGGRGIATAGGLVAVLPMLNPIAPWPAIVSMSILVAGAILFHSTPVPTLVGVLTLPIVSTVSSDPFALTMGYVALILVIIIKRLTAQPRSEDIQISTGRLLWNRLLYDRDIGDRAAWVNHNRAKRGAS